MLLTLLMASRLPLSSLALLNVPTLILVLNSHGSQAVLLRLPQSLALGRPLAVLVRVCSLILELPHEHVEERGKSGTEKRT